ncbi:MAG: hypothetical protein DME75_11240 [Verrucomicrobia bacterium]|nr:MAG: hypothetical protein DME75_11240 [Verrucomicrobiota bacterium]
MIFGHSSAHTNSWGHLLYGKFSTFKQKFQKPDSTFFESVLLWTQAIELLLKVSYLLFKVRVLRLQRRNLVRKQRDLLFQKINYVFAQSGSSRDANGILGNVLWTHGNQEVDQTERGSGKPIFRQLSTIMLCIESCQNATPTKKLSIKLSTLPIRVRSREKNYWNPKVSSVSYARLKNVSSPAKPLCQQTIEKAGKVRFLLLSALNVGFRHRHCVGSFPLWLSSSALSSAASLCLYHLKKYVFFLLTNFESICILSSSQERYMANKRLSKEKQALVLAALCEGTPIEAVARMFKIGTNTITRVIRETGEAFADYMDANFRDLPCLRIEMDEQWQYVGCHAGRLPKDDKTERGDYWLWACIDADTKLVFSHKVGKRDWWTGNTFVEDVRNRVRLPVQIATDNHRPYAFHIRQHFGYEGYSYGTETKVFGEPMLSDGTLARLGRNEGVRKMQTAERAAVVGSPDLESLTTSHVERAFLTVRQELKRFERKTLGYSKSLEMHKLAVALHFGVYNFVRKHHTLGTTPAVAAGLEEKPRSLEKVVEMTEAYWLTKRQPL